jgi:hypothetical protein
MEGRPLLSIEQLHVRNSGQNLLLVYQEYFNDAGNSMDYPGNGDGQRE